MLFVPGRADVGRLAFELEVVLHQHAVQLQGDGGGVLALDEVTDVAGAEVDVAARGEGHEIEIPYITPQ